MTAPRQVLHPRQIGFTVLELILSLSLLAAIAVASNAAVQAAVQQHAALAAREAELHDFYAVQRAIRTDLHALLVDGGEVLFAGPNSLTLRCRGEVVWEQRLGGQVVVRYQWPGPGDDMGIERTVFPVHDKTARAAWRSRIASFSARCASNCFLS